MTHKASRLVALHINKLYIERLRREAVASVHVPVKILTDKERASWIKIKASLDKGENPYTTDRLKAEGKNLGGSNQLERVIDHDGVKQRSEDTIKALELKWQSGADEIEIPVYLDLDLGTKGPPLDPNKVECSFCHRPVDRIVATTGRGPLHKFYKDEIVEFEGIKFLETKVIHRIEKANACPDCVMSLTTTDFPSAE